MLAVLFLSTAVQLVALVLALRMTRLTRRDIGWGFLALGFALMAVRRGVTLTMHLTSGEPIPENWGAEGIALAVSVAMIAGLVTLGPNVRRALSEADGIAASESRLRALIEAVPDLLFVFRVDGTFLEVVSRNAKGLNQPRESYPGRNISEFLTAEQTDHFRKTLAAAISEQRMQVVEYEVKNADGHKWWESRMVGLNDQEVLLMGRDITERKFAEQERIRLEGKLQQAQKMESLGVLAGGIAHDFNNLLTGVLGNASLAIMNMPANSPAQPCLKQIEIAAQRAGDLTKQLLAYAGKGRFLIQSLSINQVVEEMAELLKTVITKKAVLKFEFESDLPIIRADATQVRQVVMNLITNASDAIGERSGFIRLHTGVMFADRDYLHSTYVETDIPEGEYVYLEVTDTGCGMSETIVRKVFDPFYTTKFTGRGLGLAAVLGIVRGHKGAIKVQSEPHRGTTFKVLFPAAPTTERVAIGAELPADHWRGSGLVLVVDDEDTVRAVAKRTLESVGFEVRLACNGVEGLDVFRKHAKDIRCVLLDLTMPRMGGEDAFRELRQLQSDVRVVLMSGYNEQDITNQFAGKGLAGFIQKPFRASDLISMIRKTVDEKISAVAR